MTGTSVRWGILGAGGIAGTFARELPTSRTGRLHAVAARDADRAADFAGRIGAPVGYGSYEELLADDTVDAVYIATVHTTHREWAIRAADAGKHVLCEKPMTLDAAGTAATIEAARRNGVFLAEAFAYRFFPQTAKLVELIRSGAIGEVRSIESDYTFAADFDPRSRLFDPAVGGGAILDVGCYPASLARLIAGAALDRSFADPLTVEAAGHLGATGVDEFSVASLTFEGGITARLTTGVRVEGGTTLRVFGSRGHLEVATPFFVKPGTNSHIVVSRIGSTDHVEVAQDTAYALEADAVGDRGNALEAPEISWADSLGNARLLDSWRAALGLEYPAERENPVV